ncbi:MAG TPA: c-type cytochrome [Nocardioidaceae bacterium]|jgi:cytochrome c1|nr:c-type cytochrome [Nocardioidaceae bacterium]
MRVTPTRSACLLLATVLGSGLLATGCGQANRVPPRQVTAGSPDRGAADIAHYGCGTCHTIPGIEGADALVGPPLTHWAQRSYVAGMLPNSAANLEHWIRDPQSVVPGNDMPNLGVTEQQAKDIAAYLYTLE